MRTQAQALRRFALVNSSPEYQHLAQRPEFKSTYELLGEYDKALSCLEQALQLNPRSTFALQVKGSVLRDLGHWKEAIAVWDTALSVNPRLAEVWSEKAQLLDAMGRRLEADECYRRGRELQR